jgi:glutamine amidotransferase
LQNGAAFYFVHSYCYEDKGADYVVGVCEYGLDQVAVIESKNVFGAQFHPEKSQKNGLHLLQNFISI